MSHPKFCLPTSFCYVHCLLLTHSSTIPPSVTQFHIFLYNCCYFLCHCYTLISMNISLTSLFLKFRPTISLGGKLEGVLSPLPALSRSLHLFVSDYSAFSPIFHFTTSSSLPFLLFSETLINYF